MRKEINLDTFDRKFQYEYYSQRTNPFSMVTVKIDITNIVNYCKIHKNYYATIGYFMGKTVNEIDSFKYRVENNKIYKYDNLRLGFTNMKQDNNVGFYKCDYKENFKEFINHYENIYEKFKDGSYSPEYTDDGEIWLSCEPWFEFTSLIPPFDKSITIPQFIWSKFYQENEKTYTNLMIMSHHGFVDGSHLGEFVNLLNDNINKKFDNDYEKRLRKN